MRPLVLLLPALLLLPPAGDATALDITSCGVGVPAGETGVLQTDLVCPGNGTVVVVNEDATLDLNGHTIDGGGTPRDNGAGLVACRGRTRRQCSVRGLGRITNAAATGVDAAQLRLAISDVEIDGVDSGIVGANSTGSGGFSQVLASNVTIHDNASYGILAATVRGETVTTSDNGLCGIAATRVRGTGLTAERNGYAANRAGIEAARSIVATGLVAVDNANAGVIAHRARLSDSTLVDNHGNDADVDLSTNSRPKLTNVTCEHSRKRGVLPAESGGVCALD